MPAGHGLRITITTDQKTKETTNHALHWKESTFFFFFFSKHLSILHLFHCGIWAVQLPVTFYSSKKKWNWKCTHLLIPHSHNCSESGQNSQLLTHPITVVHHRLSRYGARRRSLSFIVCKVWTFCLWQYCQWVIYHCHIRRSHFNSLTAATVNNDISQGIILSSVLPVQLFCLGCLNWILEFVTNLHA